MYGGERKSKTRKKRKERKEKKENERKGKKGKRKIVFQVFGMPTGRKEKRERGARSSTFCLIFMEIGSSIFVRARGKVHLRDESFA